MHSRPVAALPSLHGVAEALGKTGNVYLDRYIELRSNLMLKFPKGYEMAYQGTAQWLLYAPKDGRAHPEFGLAGLDRDWSDIDLDGSGASNSTQASA